MTPDTSPAPAVVLAAFLALVVVQRLAELALSARNARRLRERGARVLERDRFPWIVLIHALFPLALAAEVLALGARPGAPAPLWAAVWLAAQGLRYWAIRTLGERWNVRVIVLPGVAPVAAGPYRFLRHPNYLAVLAEMVAGPLIFGAWRTALAFAIANLVALAARIRIEERALADAAAERA